MRTGRLQSTDITPGDVITQPAIPSAGTTLFTRCRSGKRLLSQIGVLGHPFEMQSAIYSNPYSLLLANPGTVTWTAHCATNTYSGTVTARSVAATNVYTAARRIGFLTSTYSGSGCGTVGETNNQLYTGQYSRAKGFLFVCRFGFPFVLADQRWMVGLSGYKDIQANTLPRLATGWIGFGQDGAYAPSARDSTIHFFTNALTSGVEATKQNLVTLPTPSAAIDWYEARIFCAAGGDRFYYSIENLATGTLVNGETGTGNLPPINTLLTHYLYVGNGVTTGSTGIDFQMVYIETDN